MHESRCSGKLSEIFENFLFNARFTVRHIFSSTVQRIKCLVNRPSFIDPLKHGRIADSGLCWMVRLWPLAAFREGQLHQS